MNRNKTKPSQLIRILLESVFTLLIIKIFILSPFIVSGESMNNSLKENDVLLTLKKTSVDLITGYSRENLIGYIKNKIVVIKKGESLLIKRCIGTEGDTLIFSESFNADTFIVPKDSIFVLGDNFRDSYDSRRFGFIPVEKIVGVRIATVAEMFGKNQ